MKKLVLVAVCIMLAAIGITSTVDAAVVVQPSEDMVVRVAPSVIVTGIALEGANVEYVQLYNNSSTDAVNLAGWRVEVVFPDKTSIVVAELDHMVAPGKYILIAKPDSMLYSEVPLSSYANTSGSISAVRLVPAAEVAFLPQEIPMPVFSTTSATSWCHGIGQSGGMLYLERRRSESTGSYSMAASPLCYVNMAEYDEYPLYSDKLYQYIDMVRPQIVEIVANSKNCAPNDESIECGDYVKLYNPYETPIDLSHFRLRNGYAGQIPANSNTTLLSGEIKPGGYGVLSVNVTNTGGWVWLEELYGAVRYDETMVKYPDASAASKKGQAWAYDELDGAWKWTTQPSPYNGPNVFPPPAEKASSQGSTLKPCAANQYRSPETNRCRRMESSSSLTPCREGQYRHPETNRCRNFTSAASALTPCREGQERNPATNRCRSTASAASTLTPCRAGQERNPATNRCRTVVSSDVPAAAFAVEPVPDSKRTFAGWWALAGIGGLALGYAGWEWRRELWGGLKKAGALIGRGR